MVKDKERGGANNSVRKVPDHSAKAGRDQNHLYENFVERILPKLSVGTHFKEKNHK